MIAMSSHVRTDAEPWRCECPAFGLRSDRRTPALDLCRQLVAADVPDQPATVYRDGKPAMLIRSVYEAAKVTVLEDDDKGPAFAKWRPFTVSQDAFSASAVAPPMRQTNLPATP